MQHKITFKIGDVKGSCKINAASKEQAKQKFLESTIIEIEELPSVRPLEDNDVMNFFNRIFGVTK